MNTKHIVYEVGAYSHNKMQGKTDKDCSMTSDEQYISNIHDMNYGKFTLFLQDLCFLRKRFRSIRQAN